MKKNILIAAALVVAACGPRPAAEVEKVDLFTQVGDNGLLVDAIEITVSNPKSLKGLPITLVAASLTSLSFLGFAGFVDKLIPLG